MNRRQTIITVFQICRCITWLKGGGDEGQAYLFVDTSNSPATTTYIDNFSQTLAALKKGIVRLQIRTPYLIAKPGQTKEIYPKISLYPVK